MLYRCDADDPYGHTLEPSLDHLAALPYGESVRPIEPHRFVTFDYADG